MGFVKTQEEVARIREAVVQPRFVNAEVLQIEFLTEPATVARLLPPRLEPGSLPLIAVMVGRWQSNCVGDFEGGAVYVLAKHGGIEGAYALSMYMNQDASIIFGRELFGEPKKQASMGLNRKGTRMSGWVERHGVRIIDLQADVSVDLGPVQSSTANFNIKALPATNGEGLEGDAILTVAEFRQDLRVYREGAGSIVLRGTPHDPLNEIEIVKVLRGTYLEGDLIASARNLDRIPAAEYLPYYYGRLDDWSLLNTEAALNRPV